tara:strand:+ start:838 stop:1182 length:345 start_codon:yes stop_codon:yes gene_type:complete
MATIITWDCKTVECYSSMGGHTNVIYNVYWKVIGTSDTLDEDGDPYRDSCIGIQALDTSDLSGFTAFSNLTHSDIISWTKAALGSEQVTATETKVQSKINDYLNPSSVTLTVSD